MFTHDPSAACEPTRPWTGSSNWSGGGGDRQEPPLDTSRRALCSSPRSSNQPHRGRYLGPIRSKTLRWRTRTEGAASRVRTAWSQFERLLSSRHCLGRGSQRLGESYWAGRDVAPAFQIGESCRL